MSKGSKQRPTDKQKYDDGWDRIFGNKKKPDQSKDKKEACWCYNCNKDVKVQGGIPYTTTTMIVCPTCGNKRCPHGTDHNLACTGSNEPGQPGSRY